MNIKSNYPHIENITYLNTAASGLLPKPVLDFKLNDLQTFYEKGSGYLADENEIVHRVKSLISLLFNADAERIGITPNFSLAFNAVLDGFSAGTSFLCLEEDYLSVIMPIKTRNFQYHCISITADVESDIYNYIEKHEPEVLALSAVQYLNGIKINIDFFAELKRDFPELKILVDATQYLGTEKFDFKSSGIDLLVASCYKWLNAGYGSAIVLLSEDLHKELSPKQVGSNSFFNKEELLQKPMGFLEPGHYDLNTIGALETALDFHYNEIGIVAIEKHINSLSKYVFENLKSLGFLEDEVIGRNRHSSIFMLNINQDRFEDFEKANIILSKRGDGLRVSFNYFNSFDDFEYLLEVLKA